METIGDRIRKAREAKGLKQPQLSDAAGVSKGTISMWETGVTNPRGQNLYNVAKVLGVSSEYLLTGKEPDDDGAPKTDPAIEEMTQLLQSASEEDRERAVRIVQGFLSSGRD